MPPLETTLLLLGVPTAAGALASLIIGGAYSDLKAKVSVDPSRNLVPARVIVFLTLVATPALFGLVLWILVTGLEADYGPLAGLPSYLAFWASTSFAFTCVVVVGAETWIARGRLEQLASQDFGRVFPFTVIPQTAVIFALILSFLTLGIIGGDLDGTELVSEARAARIVLGLQVFALSSVTYLVSVPISNRIRDITTTQLWVRALVRIEIGAIAPIAGLVWAFLQLAS